jgi:hypothetical protein
MRRLGHDETTTLFAGDSGNDLEVLVSPIPSVLVANGHPEVREQALRLAAANGQADRLYCARGGWSGMNGNYSAGILEAIAHFRPDLMPWLGHCDPLDSAAGNISADRRRRVTARTGLGADRRASEARLTRTPRSADRRCRITARAGLGVGKRRASAPNPTYHVLGRSRSQPMSDSSTEQPIVDIFGEVLFDCFPGGRRVLGGAPFNVAWHLRAFGAAPRLISAVGDDPQGEQVRRAMQDWGMDTSSPANRSGSCDGRGPGHTRRRRADLRDHPGSRLRPYPRGRPTARRGAALSRHPGPAPPRLRSNAERAQGPRARHTLPRRESARSLVVAGRDPRTVAGCRLGQAQPQRADPSGGRLRLERRRHRRGSSPRWRRHSLPDTT